MDRTVSLPNQPDKTTTGNSTSLFYTRLGHLIWDLCSFLESFVAGFRSFGLKFHDVSNFRLNRWLHR